MNIAVVSVFNVSLLKDFVYPEYRERIRNLNSNFTPAVSTLTLELIRKGETIIIFTQDEKARKVEEFHGDRVHVYVAPQAPKLKRLLYCGLSTVIFIKRLFKLYKGRIDAVSAQWTRDYAIAAGEFIGKVPVFVTIRDIMPKVLKQAASDKLRWRWIWLMNEYVVRKKGYRFISNSDYTAHEAKRYWGLETPVVPNPIAMPELNDNGQDCHPFEEGNITITSISQGDFKLRWKNIPALLSAFAIFRKDYPKARLNLVGPYFTDGNPLVEEYSNMGLLDGVMLMGKKTPNEVIEILRQSTMMVHPSLEETFGNTLIESLACATPIVGGLHSGAVPWVLEHGQLGYLCDVTSPQSIADTMQYVVKHYPEAKDKALKGQKICMSTYNVCNVAEEYLSVVRSSINK